MYVYIYIYIYDIGGCGRAVIGVPWCLRRLGLFSTCLHMLTNKSPPGLSMLTPAMAHLRWHTSNCLNVGARVHVPVHLARAYVHVHAWFLAADR